MTNDPTDALRRRAGGAGEVIRYFHIEETTWPVDVSTDDEDSAEWVQRYGTPERREAQRMAVASILSAYESLTNSQQTQKDAKEKLTRARKANDGIWRQI